MDQQLKQRLIGVTIAVALVVIFVPMLFEKSDDKGKVSNAGIPPIPEDVLEKPLALPKTAEDLAPKEAETEKGKEKKASVEGGYRIVPLNDEPPPAVPKPVANKTVGNLPQDDEEGEGTDESAVEENTEGTPASQAETTLPEPGKPSQPGKPSSAEAKHPGEAKHSPVVVKKAPAAAASRDPDSDAEDDPVAAPAKAHVPVPAVKPAAKPPVQTAHAVAKKPEEHAEHKPEEHKKAQATKPAEPHPPVLKTVKVNKPKPVLPSTPQESDEDGEPIPAPAKADSPSPAPKPAVVKKPETSKPVQAHHPAAKTDKTVPADGKDKPPAAKPATHAAKPGDAATPPPPQAKKPASWAVQAGSFTDEAAAHNLAEKLKQSKFPASVQAVHGEHGSVYRVQVGAEHDRGRAEETLKQLEGSTGISGIITQHR